MSGQVLTYRPRPDPAEETRLLGMSIFLGAWTMIFAALLLAYGFLRARSPAWPPTGVGPVSKVSPLLGAGLLLSASGCVELGRFWVQRALPRRLGGALLVAALLGGGFLGLQLAFWSGLRERGVPVRGGGPFASVMYGLTGFHALHVAIGVVGLLGMAAGAFRGKYPLGRQLSVRLWARFWHFVVASWAAMAVLMFVI